MSIAEQIALTLANRRLRETLRAQSIRDPLTGLFNRRYVEESLEREVIGAAATKRLSPFSCWISITSSRSTTHWP